MTPKRPSFLRKCRQSKGMSTIELGKSLGILPNYISKIEYGKITCGELMARRLGEFFGMDWKLFLNEKYS